MQKLQKGSNIFPTKNNSATDFVCIKTLKEYLTTLLTLLHSENPIALRKAKIVYNFGLSECNRIKLAML